MSRAVITFVRNPELGKVKTRIAAEAGQQEALRIYKELLHHTKEVLLQVTAVRYVYYTGAPAKQDEWSEDLFQKRSQVDGDLGTKLKAAFAECLSAHDEVLVIGSDCGSLEPKHIDAAFEALKTADVTFGPTLDGGYYLLGLKKYSPTLFEDINWSTESVLAETIMKVHSLAQTYTLLEKLSDIDYLEDWQKYGWD